jgi:hypothetical protein
MCAALGSISALQWTAFSSGAGDLTTASADEIQDVLAVAVGGLVTAVQAILPDLAANKGALLVTNGGLGFFDPQFDAIGVTWNAMGVSVANSAKHKVVALLAHKLIAQGIYAGEVVVTRTVTTVKDNNDPAVLGNVSESRFDFRYGLMDRYVQNQLRLTNGSSKRVR